MIILIPPRSSQPELGALSPHRSHSLIKTQSQATNANKTPTSSFKKKKGWSECGGAADYSQLLFLYVTVCVFIHCTSLGCDSGQQTANSVPEKSPTSRTLWWCQSFPNSVVTVWRQFGDKQECGHSIKPTETPVSNSGVGTLMLFFLNARPTLEKT